MDYDITIYPLEELKTLKDGESKRPGEWLTDEQKPGHTRWLLESIDHESQTATAREIEYMIVNWHNAKKEKQDNGNK